MCRCWCLDLVGNQWADMRDLYIGYMALWMWKKQCFFRNVLLRRLQVYFLRFVKIEINKQFYFVKLTFQSDLHDVKLILFAYFSCFQYWTISIMMPNKRNFIPLTTTPKATVNSVLLEARDISFPWNDMFDPQVSEWLECMARSQGAARVFGGPPDGNDVSSNWSPNGNTGYEIL